MRPRELQLSLSRGALRIKNKHVYPRNYRVKQVQQKVACENPAELKRVTPHYRTKEEDEFIDFRMSESVNTDLPRILRDCI